MSQDPDFAKKVKAREVELFHQAAVDGDGLLNVEEFTVMKRAVAAAQADQGFLIPEYTDEAFESWWRVMTEAAQTPAGVSLEVVQTF